MQDLVKASTKDIQDWALIKLHPCLNPVFAAAGMPFDFNTAELKGKPRR